MIKVYKCTNYISPQILSEFLQLKKYNMISEKESPPSTKSWNFYIIGKAPFHLEVLSSAK